MKPLGKGCGKPGSLPHGGRARRCHGRIHVLPRWYARLPRWTARGVPLIVCLHVLALLAAILVPVVFPLALAIVGQFIVYGDLLTHRLLGRSPLLGLTACGGAVARASRAVAANVAVEIPIGLIMTCETLFAFACILQCAINWAHKAYVGLGSACNMQGFYAGYYIFAAPSLTVFCTAVCVRTLLRPSEMTTPRVQWLVAGLGLAVHGVAALLAALPLLGAGEYMFAIDYCIPNLESTMYASLVLVWLIACFTLLAGVVAHASCHGHLSKGARALLVALVPYFALTWLWLLLIVANALAEEHVAGSSEGNSLYAPMALFLHTNQLTMPLYFGYLLRSHVYAAVSSGASQHDANLKKPGTGSLPILNATPPTSGCIASAPPSPPAAEQVVTRGRGTSVAPHVV